VSKGIVVAGVVWALSSALLFLVADPVVAAFVAIFALVVVVVAALARDWEQHPSYEERELARARRRAERKARTAPAREAARAKDRERWAAHQARQAAREGRDRG
jgi:hypothetical protein